MPDLNNIVEWASEIGDLSYRVAPDPNPVGVGIRLRVQSIKAECGALPPPLPPAPPSAPTLIYDSTTYTDIPTSAQAVLGYIDGNWPWPAEAWDHWQQRGATTKRLSVLGATDADGYDYEPGNASTGVFVDAIKRRAQIYVARPRPFVYMPLASVADWQATAHGMVEYDVLTAHWTGQAHICTNACLRSAGIAGDLSVENVVGTQYANPDYTGGHYDVSLVTEAFLKG